MTNNNSISSNRDPLLLNDDNSENKRVSLRAILDVKNYEAIKDLRYLKPYLKGKWPWIWTSLIFFIISSVLALYIPKSIGNIIDFGLSPNKKGDNFIFYFGIFSIVYVLKIITSVIQKYSFIWAGERALLELRRDLVNIILHMPCKFFDINSSGKIISRTVNDVSNLSQLFSPNFFSNVGDLILVMGALIAIFLISPMIGIPLFLLMVILVVFLLQLVGHLGRKQRRFRSIISQIATFSTDSINGLDVILSHNYLNLWSRNYSKLVKLYYTSAKKIILLWGKFPIGHTIIIGLSYATTIGIGYYGVKKDMLTIGEFVAVVTYITMLFQPFYELSQRVSELQASMSSMSKIKEILKFKKMDLGLKSGSKLELDKESLKRADIHFKNVRFTYGICGSGSGSGIGEDIFKNLNLTIPANRVTAIIGRTGSGKTTLANLICDLYPLSAGEILFADTSLVQIKRENLYANIGMVTQQLFLFEDTLRENLRLYDHKISDQQIYNILKEVNLSEKIAELKDGLDTNISYRNEFFSVGEKQLVVVARMLLRNPSILIFDEATASLDNNTEYLLQQYLSKLFLNRTTIIIAHRLSTIKLADHIVVLERGEVIEEGDPKELITANGPYAKYMSYLTPVTSTVTPATSTIMQKDY
ncbi:MAG: ABC transporter ATP-binding protein [Oligoflexia bacterium]|nr:ABC transporter ATP-binding protein [Oligoflexia bacterium]